LADRTSIAKRALQLLGAETITSINEDSPNARSCLACYEPRKKAVLRSQAWSCAIKRAALAEDATAPEHGYDRSFTLPAESVRLISPDPTDTRKDWTIEGGKILTNDTAPLAIRYVNGDVSEGLMDPMLAEAISADMADAMCEEITQSNSKKQFAMEAKKEAIKEARRVGAIEKGPQTTANDTWISVRQG
jgi:hypothetical protein